jgi:hypothetical protein
VAIRISMIKLSRAALAVDDALRGKGSPKAAGHKIAGVTRSGFRAKPGDI